MPSVQFSRSVVCSILCDPMDCSTFIHRKYHKESLLDEHFSELQMYIEKLIFLKVEKTITAEEFLIKWTSLTEMFGIRSWKGL